MEIITKVQPFPSKAGRYLTASMCLPGIWLRAGSIGKQHGANMLETSMLIPSLWQGHPAHKKTLDMYFGKQQKAWAGNMGKVAYSLDC